MPTRYLSVFLPLLPTDRLRRIGILGAGSSALPAPTEADRPSAPLVTVGKVKGAQRLMAVDPAAAKAGLRPGLALADARALCPAVMAVEADPGADAVLLDRILDWCRRFTPLAAPDGPDGLLLDIGGAAHLFGGEAGLVTAVERGLLRQGFSARATVASTPEAAWALVRFGRESIAPAPLDPGFERMMAALPLAALRLAPDIVSSLARAGLRRIGDLSMRPRGPIAARFGSGVLDRLDGALGLAKAPIAPRFEAPQCLAERRFVSGLTEAGQIEAALLALSHHLCASLDRQGRGARRIEATFFRVDGVVKRIALGTSRPIREPEALMALLRERLAAIGEHGLDTGYGFDLIRLAVTEAERLEGRQGNLDDAEGGDPVRDMADLADRLGARLGVRRVLRLASNDTHIPERAAVALPASQGLACGVVSPEPEVLPDRPIRLFERPERIDTIASVPDGPPVRFRWRRVMHEIAAIEGPERIAPEWWTGAPGLTRDYFRAEDRDGRRFWLFREGLFGSETAEATWFLHGLFG